jgi:hypothetical protein
MASMPNSTTHTAMSPYVTTGVDVAYAPRARLNCRRAAKS